MKLASPDPFAAPLIDPAFLQEKSDLDALVTGLQRTLDIMDSHIFEPFRKSMLYPIDRNDRESLTQYIRDHSDTEYHPVGTCKMGPESDSEAVVSPQLQVYGIRNLRIADASVMPAIPGGNTNAPTIMVAEKAADMIMSAV